MKRILLLSIMMFSALLVIVPSSFAKNDDTEFSTAARPSNPGTDPNEDITGKATEAEVAAAGTCRDCLARMVHNRLKDETAARKDRDSAPDAADEATRKGSR